MARPPIKQPIPPIDTPLAIVPGIGPIYPTPEYRISWEAESIALFGGDGSVDVTQGISGGGVDLETGTTGDYVKSVTGDGASVVVTGGTGKGSSPLVSLATPLSAFLLIANYTAADVRTKLLTVDGAGSGVDADLLDGQHGAYYLAWANFSGKPTTLSGYGITDAATDGELTAGLATKVTKTAAISDAPTDANEAHTEPANFAEVKTALDALAVKLNATATQLNLAIAALNA